MKINRVLNRQRMTKPLDLLQLEIEEFVEISETMETLFLILNRDEKKLITDLIINNEFKSVAEYSRNVSTKADTISRRIRMLTNKIRTRKKFIIKENEAKKNNRKLERDIPGLLLDIDVVREFHYDFPYNKFARDLQTIINKAAKIGLSIRDISGNLTDDELFLIEKLLFFREPIFDDRVKFNPKLKEIIAKINNFLEYVLMNKYTQQVDLPAYSLVNTGEFSEYNQEIFYISEKMHRKIVYRQLFIDNDTEQLKELAEISKNIVEALT